MKRKNIFLTLTLLLLVLVACGYNPAGSALQNPSLPSLTTDTGWVVDMAGTLTNESEIELEQLASEIDEHPEGYQVGIAVFKNCNCDELRFATDFGANNGIGSSEGDNGVAIVLFTEKEGGDGNAPAIGVAIGSGLEGVLNDAKVGRMLDLTYVPLRAEGKWEEGLIEFTKALDLVLSGEDGEQFAPKPINWAVVAVVVVILIILFLCDVAFFNGAITLGFLSAASKGGGGGFSGGGASR